jgi:hypothetical protein
VIKIPVFLFVIIPASGQGNACNTCGRYPKKMSSRASAYKWLHTQYSTWNTPRSTINIEPGGTFYSTAIQNCGYPETLTDMAKMDLANETDALRVKVLTEDEARRIATNIAKLPVLLKREE